MKRLINNNNTDLWKNLFEAASRYSKHKPWKHFDDNHVFGIQDPASATIGWCVVLGSADISTGLIVHLGDEGLNCLMETLYQNFTGLSDDQIFYMQKAIVMNFVGPDELDEVDMALYHKLGYIPQKGNKNFSFRRLDPGLYPWYLENKDVKFMTICLDQVLNVVDLDKQNQIEVTTFDSDQLIVMTPSSVGDHIHWIASEVPIPHDSPENDFIVTSNYITNIRKKYKKKKASLFLSSQYYQKPVQDGKGTRPFYAMILLWIEGLHGKIITSETLKPDQTWKSFQKSFQSVLKTLGYIPTKIYVDSEYGYDFLDDLCDRLNIELIFQRDHEIFADVADSMSDLF